MPESNLTIVKLFASISMLCSSDGANASRHRTEFPAKAVNANRVYKTVLGV
jgi:hypothetical protein